MPWWLWVIIGVIALPLIIYLFRVLCGLIALGLGLFGIICLFTGNITSGIILLVIAAVLGCLAPAISPDDYDWL